jgi:HD-GYP domain-containing protein (c-di-GMP phosphodiesterase class II)
VSKHSTSGWARYLPQVLLATGAVVLLPVGVVWWLYLEGVVTSYWACLALAVVLSLTASLLGSAYWKRRRCPRDVLFSELMLWEWLRRLRAQRRAALAARQLGLVDAHGRVRRPRSYVARAANGLERLAAALDAQDPYTDGHSRRVALHTALIARKLGLPRDQAAKLQAAATLHDIGKLRIPREVINKPSELTPEEFELTKRHADEGARIVSCLGDAEIVAMVRHHHERFDGAGYPSGLVEDQTPLGARIIAVADTFDALTSARPYRPATSHQHALALIAELSGSQLDPAVVRVFLKCYSGKRLAVFWTLLAISPERAVAFVGARRPALGIGSPAAMIASAAAMITIATAAFGPGGRLAPTSFQLGSVQRIARQPRAEPISPSRRNRVTNVDQSRRSVVLSPRRPGSALAGRAVVIASVVSAPGSAVPALGATHRSPSRTPGRRVKHGSGAAPGSTGRRPGIGSPSGAAGGSPSGAGTGSSSAASGGSGSTQRGTPAAGQAGTAPGSSGTGSGSAPAGPTGPRSIQDCKNGGYVHYGFTNQGQCVSSVAPNH